MFNFIRNYFWNRQREIFRYRDGTRERRADPIAVWRALLSDESFEIERDSQLMELNDRGAWGRCVTATRKALSVPEFENGGLTEDETVNLFQSFCLYVAALKKNSSPTPTSPGALEMPANFGQRWEPSGNGSAENISTSAEPNCAGPVSLPMASPPPSSLAPPSLAP